MTHPTLEAVTARIRTRSAAPRAAYLARCRRAGEAGPARAHLACGNLAHAAAASGADKAALTAGRGGNLAIVTAYNDMLSAHQPFEDYPAIIRAAARAAGGTAQMAGGVPAMCDGVTQGRPGMELSLFSRDVIALAAAVGLAHDCFDAAIFLGVCDKIVPGLVIAAAQFGHLPAVFAPAGPMTPGLPNDAKAAVRQRYAAGEIGREELLAAELASYHGPGTCTFYGTANTNQMLMEIMGLHLPGASFVNPGTALRDALTAEAARRALAITAAGNAYTPVSEILDERAFVNAIVGLHATGGSTNHAIHLVAMARAAGVLLDWADMAELSEIVPLLVRVYPNGIADVNAFHAAGGVGFLVGELIGAGLLHADVATVAGPGLARYTEEPRLEQGRLVWGAGARASGSRDILRAVAEPFRPTGGLALLAGNLGRAVIKTSAVRADRLQIAAPATVFDSQEAVQAAFRAGALNRDTVIVVRFQGPRANGMPELHALTPALAVLQDRGHRVALVTDGRMSGASGKVPAAIHVTPEAAAGGPLARLRDGDPVRLDAAAGVLEVLLEPSVLAARTPADAPADGDGVGRALFAAFRAGVGPADLGAALVV